MPDVSKGSIADFLSIKANSLAAAVVALVKSIEYGARVVRLVAAIMRDKKTLQY